MPKSDWWDFNLINLRSFYGNGVTKLTAKNVNLLKLSDGNIKFTEITDKITGESIKLLENHKYCVSSLTVQ